MIYNNKSKSKNILKIISNNIDRLVTLMYGFMILAIFMILVFFSEIDYAKKALSQNYLPTLVLMLFGMVFIVGLFEICQKIYLSFKNWLIFLCHF